MATTDMNAQIHIKDGNGNVNNIFPATKIANVEGLTSALNAKADTTTVNNQLSGKVDKETGKGLSTNDYTTAEKNKLSGIEAQANKTVVDSALSSSSENPVQNKVINTAIAGKADASTVTTLAERVTTNETDIATQTARIDAIASLPSGSTSGDAELMDIRVKADGTTASSAGTAVREQVSVLRSFVSKNAFNVLDWDNGAISDTTGNDTSSNARIRTTTYIPTTVKNIYSTNTLGRFCLYAYDLNNSFIGAWNGTAFTKDGSSTFYESLDMAYFYKNYPNQQYRIVYRISGGNVQIDTVSGVVLNTCIDEIPVLEAEQDVLTANVNAIDNKVDESVLRENTLNFSQATNINNSAIWEIGSISTSTGENASNNSRGRTRKYIPSNATSINFGTHSVYRGFYLLAYDTSDNYIGAYKLATDTFVNDGTETGFNTEDNDFDIGKFFRKYPNYRFRLSVYVRNDGSDVTSAEFTDWIILNINAAQYDKIRIVQYNIGKFNMGFDHDTPKINDIPQKIANYKEFFANSDADFVFMQEYTPYIDPQEQYLSDSTVFDPLYISKSYTEKQMIIFGQYDLRNTRFSYLHTSGDNPAYCIIGEANINGKIVAVVSGVLNSSSPAGIDHQEQGIRALTKLVNTLLSYYEYAIIGMDCNCLSQSEAAAFLNFMKNAGYKSGNWDYLGYKDTYNLSSQMYHAIDNVFVKGDAKIINFAVPDVYDQLASDHYPVIVDIRI